MGREVWEERREGRLEAGECGEVGEGREARERGECGEGGGVPHARQYHR